MISRKDRLVGIKKKKLWKCLGITTRRTIGQLSKYNSLNCGCSVCRMNTVNRRRETKQERLEQRAELKNKTMELHTQVTLEELENGSLFEYNGTYALKTEYRTENGAIEAYIVGSGEFFWGGTNNAKDQSNLIVQPITINLLPI